MKKRSMSSEEVPKYIHNTIDELEVKKLEGLDSTMDFQLINLAQMEVESKRLTNKYGSDHSRVQKLTNKIASSKNMVAALELQIKFSNVKTEDFDPDTWRVQGFIYGSNDKPLQNMIVFIASGKEEALKSRWFGKTDALGFYSITVEKGMIVKSKEIKLLLHVSDNNKRIIYTDTNPLTPAIGVIDLADIFISEKDYKPRAGRTTKK